MDLIPVIDLMNGAVVRAQRGERSAYKPIVSPLCGSSDPLVVARILCEHCAAERLYVADLDALQHRPPQAEALRALLLAQPALTLWLDAGFRDAADADALRRAIGAEAARIVPVFGSESLRSREAAAACFAPGRPPAVLSLDRRGNERLDPAGCWDAPQLWPQEVIVMTLERVGADAGPDLDTMAELQRRSPATRFVGAGGVRDAADLARAAAAGASAWLVASALHDRRLPPVRR